MVVKSLVISNCGTKVKFTIKMEEILLNITVTKDGNTNLRLYKGDIVLEYTSKVPIGEIRTQVERELSSLDTSALTPEKIDRIYAEIVKKKHDEKIVGNLRTLDNIVNEIYEKEYELKELSCTIYNKVYHSLDLLRICSNLLFGILVAAGITSYDAKLISIGGIFGLLSRILDDYLSSEKWQAKTLDRIFYTLSTFYRLLFNIKNRRKLKKTLREIFMDYAYLAVYRMCIDKYRKAS